MSMKLAVTLVALLSACGGGKTSTTFLPSADLAQTGDADLASTSGQDLASGGAHDFAQSVPQDLAVAGAVDMAQVQPGSPDLAQCSSDKQLGKQCASNAFCCNLCGYGTTPSGYACCYQHGTNCAQDSDCCGSVAGLHGVCTNGNC